MKEFEIKISRTEKIPNDCIGKLFINSDRVYSYLTDTEDMIKSNQHFGAVPYEMYAISNEDPKVGDWQFNNLTGKVSKRTDSKLEVNASNCFKIEYTTDQDIDLPKIETDFVKEYVLNKRKSLDIKYTR